MSIVQPRRSEGFRQKEKEKWELLKFRYIPTQSSLDILVEKRGPPFHLQLGHKANEGQNMLFPTFLVYLPGKKKHF